MSEMTIVLDGVEYEVVGETPREIIPKWSKDVEKTIPRLGQSWVPRDFYEKNPDACDIDPAGNPFGADDGGRFCIGLKGKSVQLRAEDRVIVVRPKEGLRGDGREGGPAETEEAMSDWMSDMAEGTTEQQKIAETLLREDLWPMLMSAIRYSFGRKSGIAADVRLWCRRYKEFLHPWQRAQIAEEIREAVRQANAAGGTLGGKIDEDALQEAAGREGI